MINMHTGWTRSVMSSRRSRGAPPSLTPSIAQGRHLRSGKLLQMAYSALANSRQRATNRHSHLSLLFWSPGLVKAASRMKVPCDRDSTILLAFRCHLVRAELCLGRMLVPEQLEVGRRSGLTSAGDMKLTRKASELMATSSGHGLAGSVSALSSVVRLGENVG